MLICLYYVWWRQSTGDKWLYYNYSDNVIYLQVSDVYPIISKPDTHSLQLRL